MMGNGRRERSTVMESILTKMGDGKVYIALFKWGCICAVLSFVPSNLFVFDN